MPSNNRLGRAHRYDNADVSRAARPLPPAQRHSRSELEMTVRPVEGSPAVPHHARPKLSARALNVLKLLAAELTGTPPPPGKWTPPNALLKQLTAEVLMTARNCGPQTRAEILSWARSRGVTVRSACYSGKSLQAIWSDLDAKFAAGKIVKDEIAEALEKSVRRRSRRIPVTVQKILLAMLRTGGQ